MLTFQQENVFKAVASTQFLADELRAIMKDHGPLSSRTEEAEKMLQQMHEMEKKLSLMLDGLS